MTGGGGAFGPQIALETGQRAQIVKEVSAAQRSQTTRFWIIFTLVWVILIVGIGAFMWNAGRVSVDFITLVGPIILRGASTTILVSIGAIVLATALAIVGALGRLSANPVLNGIASLYVSLVRGTPLLVQIYFVFFALPQAGIVLDPIPSGIIALGFNYGAYMTEIFRAGIQAVPRGQREAAGALGMPEARIFRRIVMPQAVRIVIPAIGNEFIAMIKDSSLVSLITVQELLWYAEVTGRREFQILASLTIAALVYWILTLIFTFFQARLERRMARSDR